MSRSRLLLAAAFLSTSLGAQQSTPLAAELERRLTAVMPKVVAWRRDLHEHPELSGQEERTARVVAEHLRALGLEVRTGVGGHGVVGVLRGGRPGRTVALRADMDGLPVTEQVDLPFRSRATAQYNGQTVGVMHACGHDNHVAILMGTAELLAGMKAQIPGNVVFIFQPAEEGLPDGSGGAQKMIAEGVMENPRIEAIFGLHVWPNASGTVQYRVGPMMAAANSYRLIVHGKQTHGANPWGGVDPIVVSSQIILAFQTIISRQVDISANPAILTVGQFQGGVRNNIIPDSAWMVGTVRTFDVAQRADIFARMERTAQNIAEASGARVVLKIDSGYTVTVNDTALTNAMLPTLRRAAGAENVGISPLIMPAEDFSFFQERVPGLYLMLGVTPRDRDPASVPRNHSPFFFADEAALPVGVKTLSSLALDWLSQNPARR
jgi:amidohydrolase